MPLLFSYGTLREPAVQLRVFGREIASTPDELIGFSRRTIEVRDPAFAAINGFMHAIVQHTGDDHDRTAGSVLELTEADLALADAYEPQEYRRIEARFGSGRRGWVYADANTASTIRDDVA